MALVIELKPMVNDLPPPASCVVTAGKVRVVAPAAMVAVPARAL